MVRGLGVERYGRSRQVVYVLLNCSWKVLRLGLCIVHVAFTEM